MKVDLTQDELVFIVRKTTNEAYRDNLAMSLQAKAEAALKKLERISRLKAEIAELEAADAPPTPIRLELAE